MFSKLTTLSFCLLATGCSLKFNDKVTAPVARVDTGAGCLSQSGAVIERFAEGTLSAEDHDAYYTCVDHAFNNFLGYTSGQNQDSFTPEELARFLSRAFLKGKPIPDKLLKEAMALKQAFVGGPVERWNRSDVEHILNLAHEMRALTSTLRPLMPLRAHSFRERGFTADRFEEGMASVVKAGDDFGDKLAGGQQAYSFEHATAFFTALRDFLYDAPPADDHWTNRVIQYSAALAPSKTILVGHSGTAIEAGDWARLYRLAPRAYTAYIRLSYYLEAPLSNLSGPGLHYVVRLSSDFIGLFDAVLANHASNAISSDEVDDMVNTLYQHKLLPCDECDAQAARQFVKVVFGRLLGSSSGNFVITADSLTRLKESLRYAFNGFAAIETIYRQKYGEAFAEGTLSRAEIETSGRALTASARDHSAVARYAVDDVLGTPRDLHEVFTTGGFGITIPKPGTELTYPYWHMVKAHTLRAVNRLVLDAYGTGGPTGSLSIAQAGQLFGDIFPILTQYKLVSPTLRDTLTKRVVDASLFLYSSDGLAGLSAHEALELEALLLSTQQFGQATHQTIATECAVSPAAIPAECYRNHFLAESATFWEFLPGLADFMKTQPAPAQAEIFDQLNAFLRKGTAADAPYVIGDSFSLTLFPYYVEILFSHFDANQDGFLDNAEAEAAYAVFEPLLAEKANKKGFTSDADHRAIYNYLLAKRALPTDSAYNQADFLLHRYALGNSVFRLDRAQVIQIFQKLLSI